MQKAWIFLLVSTFSVPLALADEGSNPPVQIFSLPSTPADDAPVVVPVEILPQSSKDEVKVRPVGPFGNLHGSSVVVAPAETSGFGTETSWSVRLSSPQLLSFSYGFLIGHREMTASGISFTRGAIVQAELGIGGAKASAGFAWREKYTLQDVKASALYSWWIAPGLTAFGDDAFRAQWKTQGTWAGIEYDHDHWGFKTSVGAMYKVQGDKNDGRFLLTLGIGFGGL